MKRRRTNPESLLAEEVRMSTPGPKTTSNESLLSIIFTPLESCTDPLIVIMLETVMFKLLESILLVVGSEFDCERNETECATEDVRGGEASAVLVHGGVGGNAEEE